MKDYIEERVGIIADFILGSQATVRDAAQEFRISKSTVHKDVSERLCELCPQKAAAVREILLKNKEERHIRGGIATHNKYKKVKDCGLKNGS